MRKKTNRKNNNAGFSLVEFIVVLTIFSIMSSISLFNYSGYSQTIRETNVAQDIALTIRQAQVYGISAIRRSEGGGAFSQDVNLVNIQDITDDRSIRGVYIDAENETITLFEDFDRDNTFDPDDFDRIIDVRTITTPGVEIVAINMCTSAEGIDCFNPQETATITFQRPYPDAYFLSGSDFYNSATVLIGDNIEDYSKTIQVTAIGNISVKNNHEN